MPKTVKEAALLLPCVVNMERSPTALFEAIMKACPNCALLEG